MPPKATQPALPAWPEPCSVEAYPDLAADFVTVPPSTSKSRADPLNLPENKHLPYAADVTDNRLFKVTSKTTKKPEGNKRIRDYNWLDIEVDDSADSTRGRGIDGRTIYGAYQRVTGHANLDDLIGLPDPAAPKAVTDDEQDQAMRKGSMYFNYACMHNNLCLLRKEGELTGEGIYYLAQRLVTYTQQVNPGRGLGPLVDGKWWIAPPAYHIVEWRGHDPTKIGASPDNGIRSKALPLAGDQAIAIYGQERGVDKDSFEAASFTFHFVNLNQYWYAKPEKGERENVSGHWSLIIRHAATNEAYYLDSMWDKGKTHTEQVALQQRILGLFNAWLKESYPKKKDKNGVEKGPDMEISTLHPINITRQFTTNSCGNLSIANLLAFICYGRFGWAAVDAWKPAPGKSKNKDKKLKPTYATKEAAEAEMLKHVGRSLHRLMGLRWEDVEDVEDTIAPVVFDDDMRTTSQNWKPSPAKPVTPPAPVTPAVPPQPPVQPAPPATDSEIETKLQEIARKEASIARKKERLAKKREKLDDERRVFDQQTADLAEQNRQLGVRKADLDKREADLDRREAALADGTISSTASKPPRERDLLQREVDVATREADVGRREVAVGKREADVTKKEEALFYKYSELDTTEEGLTVREIAVNKRGDKLDKKAARLEAKERALNQREATVGGPQIPQNLRQLLQEIDRREIAVTAREDQVRIEEDQLARERGRHRQPPAPAPPGPTPPGPTPPAPTPPAPAPPPVVHSDTEDSDTSQPIIDKFEELKARNRLTSTATSQVAGEEERLNEADAENKEPEVLMDYEDYEEEEHIPNPDNEDEDAGKSHSSGKAKSSSGKASSARRSSSSSGKRKFLFGLDGTDEGSRSLKRKMDTLAAQTEYANKKRKSLLEAREDEMQDSIQQRVTQRELLRQRELEEINRKKK
ncbi:hypothetical protein QBC37DRAFT_380896 [Rhypophila decipiens]|uniref:Ubiquitin-like protease family profile domain-containing protein n=1 Tax=Rhypophila decipiens TaxID=261697 RepID=A0AAN6XU32_9PEZI|nr:hypothetical protein QBC37DRAFT_380896 [Rhypophila decipiens]